MLRHAIVACAALTMSVAMKPSGENVETLRIPSGIGTSKLALLQRLFDQFAAPLKRFVVVSQAGHRMHLEQNRRQLYQEIRVFLEGEE